MTLVAICHVIPQRMRLYSDMVPQR